MTIQSFPTTISSRQLQRDYKGAIKLAKKSATPIVILSNNTPQGAIINMDQMNEFIEYKNQQLLWETIARIQAKNQDNDLKKVTKDVNSDVKSVRKEIYAQTFGRS